MDVSAGVPSAALLERYADLLVGYALGGGAGVQRGETAWIVGSEDTKPLFIAACRAVWRAGGNVIHDYLPADDAQYSLRRTFLEEADGQQLDFFPAAYVKGRIDDSDHMLYLHAERDLQVLRDADPEKLMRRQAAQVQDARWRNAKEEEGRFSWTIALYGTAAMAAEAGLSLDDYWAQIIKACYLEDPDPVARWRALGRQIDATSTG